MIRTNWLKEESHQEKK